MRSPDFFIVGAPRSGTTSMWHYLRQHPEIYMPPEKEPHFFGSDLRIQSSIVNAETPLEGEYFLNFPPWHSPRTDEDRDQYLSSFLEGGEVACAGEASTWYLYSKKAAAEIKEFNPSAKIIIMLRNPVDMLVSLHSLFVYLGIDRVGDLRKALDAENCRRSRVTLPENCTIVSNFIYLDAVRYIDQVERYLDTFERDQVHMVIYDEFDEDVAAAYRETLRFLNVKPDFRPEFKIIDPGVHSRVKALQSFEIRYGQRIRRFLLSVPKPIGQVLLGAIRDLKNLNYSVGSLRSRDPRIRLELQQLFKPEIERLSRLLNRDLTHWVRG